MRIDYFAKCSKDHAGVIKKINNTVSAFKAKGYVSYAIIESKLGLKGTILIAKNMISSDAEVMLLRSLGYNMILLFPIFIWLRLRGKKLILDVPTPCTNQVHEIYDSNEIGAISKYIRIFLLVITFPTVTWLFNRVLQYAPESKYFSFGASNKSVLISNGIDTKSNKKRSTIPVRDREIRLIGVGSLGFWHGYDRLLTSLNNYEKARLINSNLPIIKFTIVGEGAAKSQLEDLIEPLGLRNLVEFRGHLIGDDLDKEFSNAHIAVGTLCGYRKGLHYASELKLREYCCKGIPFIQSLEDGDFPSELSFTWNVPNDDSIIDLENMVRWFDSIDHDKSYIDIRKYAELHLDFSSKIEFLIP